MPINSNTAVRNAMKQAQGVGFRQLSQLGRLNRDVLEAAGFASVTAEEFQAPSVIVSNTSDPEIESGAKFKEHGLQIAGGGSLQCDEGDDFSAFRIGLFGLDKLNNIERTVDTLAETLLNSNDFRWEDATHFRPSPQSELRPPVGFETESANEKRPTSRR